VGRGLSAQQKAVLLSVGRDLIAMWERLEASEAIAPDERTPEDRIRITRREWQLAWGAPWQTRACDSSQRASYSRALRRLQEHGLVERRNQVSGSPRRTTHVQLTPAGWEVFEQLAAQEPLQQLPRPG
jgi:hypothetical protein